MSVAQCPWRGRPGLRQRLNFCSTFSPVYFIWIATPSSDKLMNVNYFSWQRIWTVGFVRGVSGKTRGPVRCASGWKANQSVFKGERVQTRYSVDIKRRYKVCTQHERIHCKKCTIHLSVFLGLNFLLVLTFISREEHSQPDPTGRGVASGLFLKRTLEYFLLFSERKSQIWGWVSMVTTDGLEFFTTHFWPSLYRKSLFQLSPVIFKYFYSSWAMYRNNSRRFVYKVLN